MTRTRRLLLEREGARYVGEGGLAQSGSCISPAALRVTQPRAWTHEEFLRAAPGALAIMAPAMERIVSAWAAISMALRNARISVVASLISTLELHSRMA
jgi:hypothetical protein